MKLTFTISIITITALLISCGSKISTDVNDEKSNNTAAVNADGLNIQGTMSGGNGSTIYLFSFATEVPVKIDSSTIDDSGLFKLSNKRNIITNSSEYYNLSYEYINDCLRAGLVYRREFYNDSELEPENSLMFKITLSPFGAVTSPKFDE